MPIMQLQDAPQRALSFLLNQTMRIEREAYAVRYPDIQYPQLVPVDTTGPAWVKGVTYFSSDIVGRAKWFAARGQDVPHAEVLREKFETVIGMGAVGYDYDIEELAVAQMQGVDLRADKATAARRASEEFIDKVAITGDTTKNYLGLINQTSVTAGSVAATGTGSTTTWSTKTADNILADINAILTSQFNTTYGAEMANTLLIPYSRLLAISTMRIDTYNTQTVLDWMGTNNIYTRTTGQALTIRGIWGLDTAGSGATARMVAYRRSPDVLVMQMPMPFQFLPPWQQAPLLFEVPGIMRISGVDVRRPQAMRYGDGI